MLKSNPSIISIIVPHTIFIKITSLWQNLVDDNELNGIYLSEHHLIAKKEGENKANNFKGFQLFVAKKIQILLLLEKQIDQLFYQISITFDPQEIIDFIELSQHNLAISGAKRKKIIFTLKQQENNLDIKQNFLFALLKILTEYLTLEEEYTTKNHQAQSIEAIVKNKIAQDKILHQITQQIQQDLDPLIIIKTTIEQVQSLLKVDRVLVYQINVPIPQKRTNEINKEELIDIVTYEAKASHRIPSVLNYQEENCFQNREDCLNKYLEGFCLVIEDINQYDLDICLQKLMHKFGVKAKIAIPIVVQNKLWGLLIAHQCLNTRKWKNSEINFLKNIAEYLALAIYQNKSYQKLQAQKKLLQEQIENKAKQLKDALIAAQVAHQSKTEFLGSISHELRTPLTCVIGLSATMLHWLKEPTQNELSIEKRVRYLQMIQESGRKLLQLINNVLDFADLEAGKSLLNIHPFSLENMAKIIESSGKKLAIHHGVNVILDYQVSPELDLFNGDEERVYQILLNLVDNAIKFTPEGGNVIIQFRRNQSQAIFQIKDTGIGINHEQIPLLFTQFKQLENYRNRRYSGTGLGLALTKHLVELHGGIIEVDSLINKGSVFTVFLPNSQEKVRYQALVNTQKSQEIKMNKTIVIICNDEEIGTFLCELLTAADYQIIWLLDEQEAITKIRLIKPIIVILEQEDQVSIKITQRIKSQVRDYIYLIVIKDIVKGNEWDKLSSAGVNEYLLKPLQPRVLLNKIDDIVNNLQLTRNN